jgi:hypothetical protein
MGNPVVRDRIGPVGAEPETYLADGVCALIDDFSFEYRVRRCLRVNCLGVERGERDLYCPRAGFLFRAVRVIEPSLQTGIGSNALICQHLGGVGAFVAESLARAALRTERPQPRQ